MESERGMESGLKSEQMTTAEMKELKVLRLFVDFVGHVVEQGVQTDHLKRMPMSKLPVWQRKLDWRRFGVNKKKLEDTKRFSPVPPLKGVFGPIVVQVGLKQTNNDVKEFFFVEKAIVKSPIILVR
jgi:hypothetical protein